MSAGSSTLRALNGFLELLMQRQVAVDYVPAVETSSPRADAVRVTWSRSRPAVFVCDGLRLSEYLACVDARQYSALLHDGSFVQISYDVGPKSQIVGHRLLYWPSPFGDLDLRDFPGDAPCDVINEYYTNVAANPYGVQLRGPWRFDFDPVAASDSHPETHLTAQHPECRIPGSRPLDLRRFCIVVFRHLHAVHYSGCAEWGDPVPEVPRANDLRRVDEGLPHFHWRHNS
jgi:hypothetical protein